MREYLIVGKTGEEKNQGLKPTKTDCTLGSDSQPRISMCFDNSDKPTYQKRAQFGVLDYEVPLAGYTKKLSVQNITLFNDAELPIFVRCGGNAISGNTHKYLIVVGFQGNNEYEAQELIALVSSSSNGEDLKIEQILRYTPTEHKDA